MDFGTSRWQLGNRLHQVHKRAKEGWQLLPDFVAKVVAGFREQ
jgi:hypothetical protein